MDFPLYYLLPLFSGFLYPVGSLFFKQAIDLFVAIVLFQGRQA